MRVCVYIYIYIYILIHTLTYTSTYLSTSLSIRLSFAPASVLCALGEKLGFGAECFGVAVGIKALGLGFRD